MKSHVIAFVAILMLVRPLWPVAEYVINYDYIVNVLCENKDKPELKCDGKCYLSKQLAKESRQSEENPFGEKQTKTEVLQPVYFQSLPSLDLEAGMYLDKEVNFNTPGVLHSRLFTTEISHPPEYC